MKNIIIYHNPRCSKSRQALQLLLEHGEKPQIIDYLQTPLNTKQINQLLKMLRIKPRDIMRKNETVYKNLNLDNANLKDNELISALVENPILIERPIVVVNDKAIIARPPEKILELI